MLVERKSLISGKISSREINVSKERLEAWNALPTIRRALIQIAFPELPSDDRVFILTGITPEEWDAEFPLDEEYDVDETEFPGDGP